MYDLELLHDLTDRVVPPPIESLRATARARDRRAAALLAAGAASAVVAIAATTFALSDDDRALPPVELPEVVETSRPLVSALDRTIHYGELAVEAPGRVVELAPTDDGVAFRTAGGGIWFTDGTTVDALGALGEPGRRYAEFDRPYPLGEGWLRSAGSGSHLTWFEFPEPDSPEVVVYDTHTREVLMRTEVSVEAGGLAAPQSVDDDSVYLFVDPEPFSDRQVPQARIDLATGDQTPVSAREYLADRESRPARSLQVSHAEEGFRLYDIVDGPGWQFSIRRGRLEPMGMQPLEVRDGLTDTPITLAAPEGYPNTNPVWLVQWLDDDLVVLAAAEPGKDRDLFECSLSLGACEVAASGPESMVLPEIG